jgi:hypothetical protein
MTKMFKDFGTGKGMAEPREVLFKLAGQEFHCEPVLSASAWNEGLLAIVSASGVMAVAMMASLIRKSVLHDCPICRGAGQLVPITRIVSDQMTVTLEPDDYQRFINLIEGDTEIESGIISDIFEWLWGPAYSERPTPEPAPSGSGLNTGTGTAPASSPSEDTPTPEPSTLPTT